MKCEEVENMMIDYLDRNLPGDLIPEIEKHLETCERCLDIFNESQQVTALLSKDKMDQPDDNLRINFYHMLHTEIKKNEPQMTTMKPRLSWYNVGGYRMAASVALLIAGTFIGIFIKSGINNSYTAVLKQLHSEIYDLKKTTMISMLQNSSSSERLQAVSYANDFEAADPNIISVLVKTLNEDKNVNVRMAAAYALSKYRDQAVSDSLVASLSSQTEPILQVTLINILADRKEKSAIETVQKIIANKSTLKEVRDVAENSLHVLI